MGEEEENNNKIEVNGMDVYVDSQSVVKLIVDPKNSKAGVPRCMNMVKGKRCAKEFHLVEGVLVCEPCQRTVEVQVKA